MGESPFDQGLSFWTVALAGSLVGFLLGTRRRMNGPRSGPTPDAAAEPTVANPELDRLDDAAKILVTATALTTALLAAFGVTSDKVPQLLDKQHAFELLLVSILGALLALLAGLWALGTQKRGRETILVIIGAMGLVVGLLFAVLAAASGFGGNGRPTITNIETSGPPDGMVLKFTIRAEGVDPDERIRVLAGPQVAAPTGGAQYAGQRDYSAVLRPDSSGVIQQTVTLSLALPADTVDVAIRAYRQHDTAGPKLFEDLDCASQDEGTAPACATLPVPSAS